MKDIDPIKRLHPALQMCFFSERICSKCIYFEQTCRDISLGSCRHPKAKKLVGLNPVTGEKLFEEVSHFCCHQRLLQGWRRDSFTKKGFECCGISGDWFEPILTKKEKKQLEKAKTQKVHLVRNFLENIISKIRIKKQEIKELKEKNELKKEAEMLPKNINLIRKID